MAVTRRIETWRMTNGERDSKRKYRPTEAKYKDRNDVPEICPGR